MKYEITVNNLQIREYRKRQNRENMIIEILKHSYSLQFCTLVPVCVFIIMTPSLSSLYFNLIASFTLYS